MSRSASSPALRPRSAADPDRISPPIAAGLVGLGYPEQFNVVRWQLEEAFDPATLETIPIPADLRCPLLTTSQLRRLSDADRADYAERKEARKVWARDHWMRVPAWGGRQTPGGEYRYSAQACREWYQRSLGQREE